MFHPLKNTKKLYFFSVYFLFVGLWLLSFCCLSLSQNLKKSQNDPNQSNKLPLIIQDSRPVTKVGEMADVIFVDQLSNPPDYSSIPFFSQPTTDSQYQIDINDYQDGRGSLSKLITIKKELPNFYWVKLDVYSFEVLGTAGEGDEALFLNDDRVFTGRTKPPSPTPDKKDISHSYEGYMPKLNNQKQPMLWKRIGKQSIPRDLFKVDASAYPFDADRVYDYATIVAQGVVLLEKPASNSEVVYDLGKEKTYYYAIHIIKTVGNFYQVNVDLFETYQEAHCGSDTPAIKSFKHVFVPKTNKTGLPSLWGRSLPGFC